MDDRQREELFELLEAMCDQSLTDGQHSRLETLICDDERAQEIYFGYVDLHLGLKELAPSVGEIDPVSDVESRHSDLVSVSKPNGPSRSAWIVAGAALAVVVGLTFVWLRERPHRPFGAPKGRFAAKPSEEVRLLQAAGARFFDAERRRPGDPLVLGSKLALVEGSVQLGFPGGVTAILQAPAVFTIQNAAALRVDIGRCSVHAPTGAQGFTVATPLTEVVDRGTRFHVDVAESGDTEVQVIEGRADVNNPTVRRDAALEKLTTGQARRFSWENRLVSHPLRFDVERFAERLPDRVISYRASERRGGGAEDLLDVAVQRDGITYTYAVDDLIGIDLIYFHSGGQTSNLTTVSGERDPSAARLSAFRRTDLCDRDVNLNTGVINPGGAELPLTTDPVTNEPPDPLKSDTPGFAIRFERPVSNDAGPDLVLFDLQVIVHPEHGDPFHVSPVRFRPGLHSHTIRRFDIPLSAPEALELAGFRLYVYDSPPKSIKDVLTGRHNGGNEHRVGAKALAVGIDLSDLGYEPGARVAELFFQDALDDGNYLDPVFIAGLPELPK